MRQLICNSNGALVVRVPRPAVAEGTVLVRTSASMVSVGTELALLRASGAAAADSTLVERGKAYTSKAQRYLRLALQDPGKAVDRVRGIAAGRLAQVGVREAREPAIVLRTDQVEWAVAAAMSLDSVAGQLRLETDASDASYQAMSQAVSVQEGCTPIVHLEGEVREGVVSIGLLNDARDAWLGSRTYETGRFEDRLIFDPRGSRELTLVIANAGAGRPSRLRIKKVEISMAPPTEGGVPHSELEHQGWNVGYSATGVVVAVGTGVSDLVPGDRVACAGAGQANHADFIQVKRNLVCRVPEGCSDAAASSVAIGAIALQGVRRAAPQIGETVCVIGLGLIGQITAQLLHASGCRVIGMDLEPDRVSRAKAAGMDAGAATSQDLINLVRGLTEGRGADCVLVTAATKSDSVINLATEVSRAKGKVVIVGDVGLKLERPVFYRKELDLLMSTSYGPGRYDRGYEEDGIGYPLHYVRWTLNENMKAYLKLIASAQIDIDGLIDLVAPIDEAPAVYAQLAASAQASLLGVVLSYPDDTRSLPQPADSTWVSIQGHRGSVGKPVQYALVGAGAFGTSMLVPQLKKTGAFFLKAVVSADAVRGGNFARANQVPTLASELQPVLNDPAISLAVIATRHHQHADQVVACLQAGKHVFVEKPLALTWEQLDEVVRAYEARQGQEILMVGFNRRFSPAVQALKAELDQRTAPLVMHYRVNAGFIPPDHWVQGQEGGGRNLGEACHMYDVLRHLAGHPPVTISATTINPDESSYQRNDNFAVSIGYGDGSMGSLLYTAAGAKQGLGKERIEVHCAGESYVLDDFVSLTRASDAAILWQAESPDKGHSVEFRLLGEALVSAQAAPISFQEIIETSAVALHVEDQIRGRFSDEQG